MHGPDWLLHPGAAFRASGGDVSAGDMSRAQLARVEAGLPAEQVSDAKPKRPMWGALSGGDIIGTGIAAWGALVILGDAEGNIHRWDISSGKVSTIPTHQVR